MFFSLVVYSTVCSLNANTMGTPLRGNLYISAKRRVPMCSLRVQTRLQHHYVQFTMHLPLGLLNGCYSPGPRGGTIFDEARHDSSTLLLDDLQHSKHCLSYLTYCVQHHGWVGQVRDSLSDWLSTKCVVLHTSADSLCSLWSIVVSFRLMTLTTAWMRLGEVLSYKSLVYSYTRRCV